MHLVEARDGMRCDDGVLVSPKFTDSSGFDRADRRTRVETRGQNRPCLGIELGRACQTCHPTSNGSENVENPLLIAVDESAIGMGGVWSR
ncbi:hypothetical protein ACWDR1_24965 [Streptosporangium sandarakinum]